MTDRPESAPDPGRADPSWDEIFRAGDPTGDGAARAARPAGASPEPVSPHFPTARLSDPYAVAAAEARAGQVRDEAQPISRREAKELEARARARRSGHDDLARPLRKRRRKGPIIALVVVLVLIAGAAGGAGYVWTNYEEKVREVLGLPIDNDYAGTGNGTEVTIVIQSGAIGSDVARTLVDAGVTKSYDAVYDYLVANSQISFTPGNWTLQEQMSAESAVAALQDTANLVTNSVTLPEGIPMDEAFTQIASALQIDVSEVEAAAQDYVAMGVPDTLPSIEGFIFPARYDFDPGTSAHDALQRTVTEMITRLDALGVAPEDRARVVTLASIVQRESAGDADMPKIARVFLNRIDQGMRLQSDATVAYGTGNTHTVWTTDEERADASNGYNTYANDGLPIGPIGLPGDAALDAVVHPADGPWLFFVPINLATGETVFSETADQHEAAAAQLRAWCRESAENAAYCQ